MGQLYAGKWRVLADVEVDYVVKVRPGQITGGVKEEFGAAPVAGSEGEEEEEEVVWVSLKQAMELLELEGGTSPSFSRVWIVLSSAYCPVTDFLVQAATHTKQSSTIFKDCVASLVRVALVPSDLSQVQQHLQEYSENEIWTNEKTSAPVFDEKEDLFGEEMMAGLPEGVALGAAGGHEGEEEEGGGTRVGRKRTRKKRQGFDYAYSEPTVEVDTGTEGLQLIKAEEESDGAHLKFENPEEQEEQEQENGRGEGESRDAIKRRKKGAAPLLPCQLCRVRCAGEVRLYSHYVRRHPDSPDLHPARPDSSARHACPACPELFDRRLQLLKHVRASHPDIEPPKIRKQVKREAGLGCGGCQKSFATASGLFKHCREHHPEQPEIWPEEPVVSRGLRLFHLHERTELKCGLPECGHTFLHFKGLARHERTHTESFICILCGKPCLSPENLIVHCDIEHEAKSRFVCRICGFYNYSELNLKLHTIQVHMKGTKEYACQSCPYRSSNYSTFQAHIRNHNTGKSYMCEECGKEFNTPQALSTHKRSHQPVESFQYRCQFCPKRFPHVSLLNIHERVHTGEKPYQCNHCGQCFGSQSSLIKHNRNIHTPEDQMPYKCKECGKTFSKARRKVYYGHLKQHSGIRDHVCPICQSAFSSRGYLGNHFKKVHKRKLHEVEEELKLKADPQTFVSVEVVALK